MTTEGGRILVVEDEPSMGRLLTTGLKARGYTVSVVGDGLTALDEAATWQPDVILLDLGLPQLDGFAVCQRIRTWSAVPIIVLTVRDDEAEKVAALDAGADDYLTKPFGMHELLARIRAVLRRPPMASFPAPTVFQQGSLWVDLVHRRVRVNGKDIHLTPTEYALLQQFIRHAGKVLTHRMLLHDVWGSVSEQDTPMLRVFITQLRHKIENDPTHPTLIVTEPGIGYRLARA